MGNRAYDMGGRHIGWIENDMLILKESLSEGGQLPSSTDESGKDGHRDPAAPSSESDPRAEAFDRVLERLKELATKKGKDYGTTEDTTANLRASEDFGIPPWIGCLSRGNDKMRRLMTFIKHGRLHCEPADDALEDLAVYVIWAIVFRNEETYPPGKVTSFA